MSNKLSAEQAAEYTGLSLHTIKIYANEGRIKIIGKEQFNNKGPKKYVFTKELLDEFLETRKKRRVRSDCKYKNEFEHIDTEAKAYFLGLLFSDGNMSISKEDDPKSFRIALSLQKDDEEIILKLKQEFDFLILGNNYFSRYLDNVQDQRIVRYNNKDFYLHLKGHGLVPRKSYENRELLKIPDTIPEHLIKHFVRGYFDGDGSINIATKRPNLLRADISLPSNSMTESLYKWLDSNGCKPQKRRVKFNKNKGRIPMYILEWWKTQNIIDLGNLLYKDCEFFLRRKKEKFDNFKGLIDKTDRDFTCPHCNHNKLSICGKRQMKMGLAHRFKCKNCKKRITKYFPAQIKSDELLETPKALGTIYSDNPKDEPMDNQQPSL